MSARPMSIAHFEDRQQRVEEAVVEQLLHVPLGPVAGVGKHPDHLLHNVEVVGVAGLEDAEQQRQETAGRRLAARAVQLHHGLQDRTDGRTDREERRCLRHITNVLTSHSSGSTPERQCRYYCCRTCSCCRGPAQMLASTRTARLRTAEPHGKHCLRYKRQWKRNRKTVPYYAPDQQPLLRLRNDSRRILVCCQTLLPSAAAANSDAEEGSANDDMMGSTVPAQCHRAGSSAAAAARRRRAPPVANEPLVSLRRLALFCFFIRARTRQDRRGTEGGSANEWQSVTCVSLSSPVTT
eukprot:SAG22_NODE_1069_length_5726_cov_20.690954_3_plen_295_part_00